MLEDSFPVPSAHLQFFQLFHILMSLPAPDCPASFASTGLRVSTWRVSTGGQILKSSRSFLSSLSVSFPAVNWRMVKTPALCPPWWTCALFSVSLRSCRAPSTCRMKSEFQEAASKIFLYTSLIHPPLGCPLSVVCCPHPNPSLLQLRCQSPKCFGVIQH